jgi:hypothetical protein
MTGFNPNYEQRGQLDIRAFRDDEAWLPEWSGKLGGVQRWRTSLCGVEKK